MYTYKFPKFIPFLPPLIELKSYITSLVGEKKHYRNFTVARSANSSELLSKASYGSPKRNKNTIQV